MRTGNADIASKPVTEWWPPGKIPLRHRVLFTVNWQQRPPVVRSILLALTRRWAGEGSGQDPDGAWSGWCGHTAFWKRTIANHRHPGAESEDGHEVPGNAT
jgi:hypothetical protein